ncbi:MAG: patatin-like phospholipase family protein [Phycisphaerae bacterium]|nr:patatin-like phospholipase family protein [Phycisphaerae bacterium]
MRPSLALHSVLATLSAGLLVAAFGCASKAKPPTLEELEAAELPYLNRIIDEAAVTRDRIFARLERDYADAVAAGRANDYAFDVLVLSGGGAKGAFGAGFLVGWGEITDPAWKRPQFDLVTGVSTGSLIAPMAFVGTDAAYRVANETYRNPSPDWVKSRGLLNVLFNEQSFYTNDGLFDTICSTIGPQIPAIAEGAKEERTLLVAAVNVNQGQTKVWDMSQLAGDVQRGALSPRDYCQRFLASASIPLVFPPQVIDNNLYVDGSTTSDILISLDTVRNAPSLLDRWTKAHPGVPFPTLRLWVIANTPLFVRPVPLDTSDLVILGRSLDLSVQAALLSQLKILQLFGEVLRHEGLDVQFRFVAMPDGYTQSSDEMFNKGDMDAMSALGVEMGRNPASWRTQVPSPLVPTERRNSLEAHMKSTSTAVESTR